MTTPEPMHLATTHPHHAGQLAVADMMQQHALIQEAITKVMVEGHHYGVLPGTEARAGEKPRPPMLYKPGAEKLCMLFRLAPTFLVATKDLPNGHREERVTCTLTHIPTGVVLASAMGSCSTMEAKYRYRNAKPKCPTCGAEQVNKSKHGDGFYCWAKKGGCGATFPLNDRRITDQAIGLSENKDLADVYNTVLKMAAKRAHVAATLLATAASDAFIVEEDRDDEPAEPDEPPPPTKATNRPARTVAERAPAAEPKLNTRQELARDCAKMASDAGMSAPELKQWLAENAVPTFERWGDLDETQLLRVRALLLRMLRAGAPAEESQA